MPEPSSPPIFERRYRIRLEGKNVGWFNFILWTTGVAVVLAMSLVAAFGPSGLFSGMTVAFLIMAGMFSLLAILTYPMMDGYIRIDQEHISFRSEQIIPRYWYINKKFSLNSKLYLDYNKRYRYIEFDEGTGRGILNLNGLPEGEVRQLLYILGENENIKLTLDESTVLDRLVHDYKKGEFENRL